MIVTSKDFNSQNDVVIRVGKFPTQGKKVVLTKGTTKISFPLADIPDAINALTCIALNTDPSTIDFDTD